MDLSWMNKSTVTFYEITSAGYVLWSSLNEGEGRAHLSYGTDLYSKGTWWDFIQSCSSIPDMFQLHDRNWKQGNDCACTVIFKVLRNTNNTQIASQSLLSGLRACYSLNGDEQVWQVAAMQCWKCHSHLLSLSKDEKDTCSPGAHGCLDPAPQYTAVVPDVGSVCWACPTVQQPVL